jgi:Subtilase family
MRGSKATKRRCAPLIILVPYLLVEVGLVVPLALGVPSITPTRTACITPGPTPSPHPIDTGSESCSCPRARPEALVESSTLVLKPRQSFAGPIMPIPPFGSIQCLEEAGLCTLSRDMSPSSMTDQESSLTNLIANADWVESPGHDLTDPTPKPSCEKPPAGHSVPCPPSSAEPPDSGEISNSQWPLFNPGGDLVIKRVCDVDVNALEAWPHTKGDIGILIGFVDTGLNYGSNNFADGGCVAEALGVDLTGDPNKLVDYRGHGTMVASVVGARIVKLPGSATPETKGVAGLARDVGLVPCKFARDTSSTTENAAKCLRYFGQLKERGYDVVAVNVSFEGPDCDCEMEHWIRALRSNGILVVAAAGNECNDDDLRPTYPASYPISNVIAVAATNAVDDVWGPSNLGRRSVHVGAPGEKVEVLKSNFNESTTVDGTSFAAPHVSGLIALLKGSGIGDWRVLRNRVLAGGVPVKALRNRTITGRRIRAWDDCPPTPQASCTGSLSCRNQHVRRRLSPMGPEVTLGQKESLTIKALSIGCDTSERPRAIEARVLTPTATRTPSGPTHTPAQADSPQSPPSPACPGGDGPWLIDGFRDDGVVPDDWPDDGEWVVVWDPPCPDRVYELRFWNPYEDQLDDDDNLAVVVK